MIPKIIHYIWIGDQPKPELVLKCIKSWQEFLPDYTFMEWGNDTLKDISNPYMNEALKAKKWAFVSDYLRLHVLSKFGGIYFDTDVQVNKNLDSFLIHDFFMGFEIYNTAIAPMTAVIGATQNNPIILGLLEHYNSLSFIKSDSSYDLTPNPIRFINYLSASFKNFSLKNSYILLNKTSIIYPSHYFCYPEENKDNYTIHLFNGSWLDGYSRKDKLKIGKYTLVRFKRISFKSQSLPLHNKEIVLNKIKISPTKTYAITKILED